MDYYKFIPKDKQAFLVVERDEEFSPIKSNEGLNTPENAIKDLTRYNLKVI